MLPSPITVTIAGTAHSLIRINEANFSSTYLKKGDGFEVRLQVRHQTEKVKAGQPQYERHSVDLQYVKFPATPTGVIETLQAYTVMRCLRGTSTTALEDVVKGLNTLVNAQAAAVIGWAS